MLENYRRMFVPESAPEVSNEEEPIRTAVLYNKVQVMADTWQRLGRARCVPLFAQALLPAPSVGCRSDSCKA